jgi:hypothetical protein
MTDDDLKRLGEKMAEFRGRAVQILRELDRFERLLREERARRAAAKRRRKPAKRR